MTKQLKKFPCPCGRALAYDRCCGVYHSNGFLQTPTMVQDLMRSRYSAYALHLPDYLLFSWHPDTRPSGIEKDASCKWLKLEILDFAQNQDEGFVHFKAHYQLKDPQSGKKALYELEEKSSFVKVQDALDNDQLRSRWVYWRGDIS